MENAKVLLNSCRPTDGEADSDEMNKHVSLSFLATAGMRSLQATDKTKFETIQKNIVDFFLKQGFFGANEAWKMITGEEEALYGWVTANYTLGGFDDHSSREICGFMEMGGASMQIAYESLPNNRGNYEGDLTEVTLNWGGKKTYLVYAKTFLELGLNLAFQTHQRNHPSGTIDPCLPNGYPSIIVNETKTITPPVASARVTDGLEQTRKLLGCKDEECLSGSRCNTRNRACLLENHPSLEGIKFVGGAMFWHATRGMFVDTDHYNSNGFRHSMEGFAAIPWRQHLERVGEWMLKGKPRTDLTYEGERKLATMEQRKATALFAAMLVYSCLHDGFGLQEYRFQPFNGGTELDVNGDCKPVPFSWTLGMVLLQVTGCKPQTQTWAEWGQGS